MSRGLVDALVDADGMRMSDHPGAVVTIPTGAFTPKADLPDSAA